MAHILTNFEIQKDQKSKPKFKGVYSRNKLPNTIEDGAYIKLFYKYKPIKIHWLVLYINANSVTNFYRFGAKHIHK